MKVSLFCHLLVAGRILEIDEQLELGDRATVLDAFNRLEREGVLPASAAADFRRGRTAVSLLLNGERQPWEEIQARPLADGDEISIVSPFAGG